MYWWFNTKSGEVEQGLISKSTDRIGPFDTREEALRALDTVRQRSAEWAKAEEQDRD
jgi:hypothetical protein